MNKIKFIYITQNGTISNLTKHSLQDLSIEHIQLVASDYFRMQSVYEKFPQDLNFKKFYGFQDNQTYLTSVDFDQQKNRGCQKKDKVELFDFGFKEFTNQDYLKLAQQINPQILVTLTEESRLINSKGQKSSKRSVEKSIQFLKESIEFKQKSGVGFDLYASLQGSSYQNLRELNFEAIKERLENIDGIVLYGLYRSQKLQKIAEEKKIETTLEPTFQQRKLVYQMLKQLDKKVDLVLSSDGDFLKVLEGVYNGLNSFEIQKPFNLAKEGNAIYFERNLWSKITEHHNDNNFLTTEEEIETLFQSQKQQKLVNLKNEKEIQMLDSVVNGCECYCCANHSQAYINHLLKHNEMTGYVLLTIHNCFAAKHFNELINSDLFQRNKERFIKSFYFLFTE